MIDKIIYTVYAGTEQMMQFNSPSALGDVTSFNLLVLIGNILKFFLSMVGALAIIMLIRAGFRLITGQGSEDSRKKAISTIIWTVAGIVLIIVSYSIVSWITGEHSPLWDSNQQI